MSRKGYQKDARYCPRGHDRALPGALSGPDNRCAECRRNADRARYALDGGRRDRDQQLRAKYGISLAVYEQMLEAQDGVCAICKQPPRGTGRSNASLHVDHDHATGAVRGLLCNACNRGIGNLGDNPARIVAAAHYLMGGSDGS